jgi:nucleoside-diphosphate-sugar epimerase
MIIIAQGRGPERAVLLFGLGGVGRALRDALIKLDKAEVEYIETDWSERALFRKGLEEVLRRCELLALSGCKTFHVAWCAGKAGFGSTAQEVGAELELFEDVIGLETRLSALGALFYHVVSSAGGLYEGHRLVGPESAPTPQRPYGEMSLAKETFALAMEKPEGVCIYRPSAVYGASSPTGRVGLIGALIRNSLLCRETAIVGRLGTLRDFVHVGDVANFISRKICVDIGGRHVWMLVSGRPVSIAEVVRLVEQQGKPVFLRLDSSPANAADITFSRAVRAPGFESGELAARINKLYRSAQSELLRAS